MGGRVFISYRRDDARADARSVYQRLQRTLGTNKLFMDVDTIAGGHDFRRVIDRHLSETSALLVLIGRNWLGASADSSRRLDNPDDFVRMEIASAIKRDLPIIPVLVEDAQMPRVEDLPEDIRPLAFRQAVRVTHENFANDMNRIERDLVALVGSSRRSRHVAYGAAAAVAAALAIYLALHIRSVPSGEGGSPTTAATPPVERAFTSFEANTDRPGGDYTSLRLTDADALACQKQCAEDQRCVAWTYVAPGYQEPGAVCWLKNVVPQATRSDVCCTSGVAYYRRPK
jgi:hypothetical protein